MPLPALNLLVFRDGRRMANGNACKNALAEQLRLLERSLHADEILRALLQAGELECALADSGVTTAQLEKITDAMAAALLQRVAAPNLKNLLAILDSTPAPQEMAASIPEGFAFYGLHPLAFADVLQEFAALPSRVAVIGIRSIGTTLSAVTAAALRMRGIQATRITVRPSGHPYNRRTEFSPGQLDLIRAACSCSGMFLVVDEGPGLSGSSFLSVAEALVRAGVCPDKIALICSHDADADRLCAENAGIRWRRFRSVAVPTQSRRPADAQVWTGGGEWRRYFLRNESEWPATWLSFERLKYVSENNARPRFYKFAGLGHYGRHVFQREERVAAAGFGPLPKMESDGYFSYPFVDGRPMLSRDLSESVLARLAAYCALRERACADEGAETACLQEMARHNLSELKFDLAVNLRLERGVVPDARMQPHEWLLTPQGQMLKTDSGSHGDDHFFPGASDIAWDLAGAIAEWQMTAEESAAFLAMYRRASGDDAESRIADYVAAYTVFRCAYCMMAANAMQGTDEQQRLEQAADAYRTQLTRLNLARV
jgi:hypothetical protein